MSVFAPPPGAGAVAGCEVGSRARRRGGGGRRHAPPAAPNLSEIIAPRALARVGKDRVGAR
eukprot:5439982-Prymnesium_polylepis.1